MFGSEYENCPEFGVLGGVIFKLDILKTGRLLFFGSVSSCTCLILIIIIITRFDCVWMQTQKPPNDTHIRIRACGCKFHHYQPIPHFKILLDINFH
jgi:hypothetical protein